MTIGPDLSVLLEQMVKRKASDLFLSVGASPLVKVEGQFISLDDSTLDSRQVHALCYSVLNEAQRVTFESTRELNMSLDISHIGRFRLNLFRQRGEPALVARHINSQIPDFTSLNLPPILGDLIMEDRGLVLLVGGTGTGKSSTLAAMLAHRNKTRGGHILTIEDPVEFLHSHHGTSLINQREVGLDTDSYAAALRNAMREAPDVIMIGEIRDMETMKHALAYAETGHLCVSTLHANNANQAIERILHFFPDTAHTQVLQDLSLNLRAIVSQRLTIGLQKMRVPAVEIMLNTPYISELIHFGKVEQLKDAMTQAKELGCKTLDDALYDLVAEEKIAQDEALRHADSRTNLSLRFKLEGAHPHPVMADTKRDISFVKNVDFHSYKSYRVKCALFKSSRSDLKDRLESALRTTFDRKGLAYQFGHPDIEVKFAYQAPQPVMLEMAPTLPNVDDNFHGSMDTGGEVETLNETLLVDIYDLHLDKPVWRMRTVISLADKEITQEQLNSLFTSFFEKFPPV